MIEIYHVPGTRSVRVIWLCEELGVPYEKIPVDFSPVFRASAEWRRLNPVGKVPVMRDGDMTIFESGAMVEYILDRYGEGRLRPTPGTAESGIYLQWLWFAEATLARPLGEMVNHRRVFPEARQVPAVLEEMAARARSCLAALEDALASRPYLCGQEFSAADVMTGYSLLLARRFELLDATYPHLGAYWETISSRPGFAKATA